MLRYALAVALTPDHQAQFVDALPQAPALQNIDGIIVDAAMLRQRAKPSPVDLEAVERWRVPTVLLDDLEPTLPPGRLDWVTVKIPVQREQLLKALFDCLNPAARPTAEAARKNEAKTALPAKTRAKKNNQTNTATKPASNVIELVEVVEEESEGG